MEPFYSARLEAQIGAALRRPRPLDGHMESGLGEVDGGTCATIARALIARGRRPTAHEAAVATFQAIRARFGSPAAYSAATFEPIGEWISRVWDECWLV